jgi:large subunit ribosomal protein L23
MNIGKEFDVIINVITTEKSTRDVALRKHTFIIHPSATKNDVKESVEKIFGVNVEGVNISNYDGKTKRYKGKKGQRDSFKKAIVTLKKEQTIDLSKLE